MRHENFVTDVLPIDQPHIFFTDWMRERREAAARHNIARELAQLAGGPPPEAMRGVAQ